MRSANFFFALCLIAIAGCGSGGGSGDPASSGGSGFGTGSSSPPATPTTTLVASITSLALVVKNTTQSAHLSGTPRIITVTNIGTNTALAVGYAPSRALPSGTTVTPANCGDIVPGATCILTVTPGAAPTATPGDIAPTPVTLAITGTNTNPLGVDVRVLTYGSVYQSGYVFAVDDAMPPTGSIGGKVAALTNQSAGLPWTPGAFDDIPGIHETSTSPPAACNGNVDGACNTRVITGFYSMYISSGYAAGACSSANTGGFTDWYLPAICELGYDGSGIANTNCGISSAPTLQNMQTNLVENGNVGNLTSASTYWSSSEMAAYRPNDPAKNAAVQEYDGGSRSFQIPFSKTELIQVRCVRALTN